MSRNLPWMYSPAAAAAPTHVKFGLASGGSNGGSPAASSLFSPVSSSTPPAAPMAAQYGGSSLHPAATLAGSAAVPDFDIGVFSMGGGGGQTTRFSSGAGGAAQNTLMSIGEFRVGGGAGGTDTVSSSNGGGGGGGSGGVRETGIIEKMLPTFGFIQCCERQARLFFHFSQFDGNIDHLRVGDPVEFEMTYDRRNGKPIASNVTKISPETPQLLSEERAMGTVTAEVRPPPHAQQGRISYENRGECFFLPFGAVDVEGHATVRVGDLVSFQMVSDPRTGNLVAHNVRLENPANPVRYRGVVSSLHAGERLGLIERADVVREIAFNMDVGLCCRPTDGNGSSSSVMASVGDEVEFAIQTVQGKEMAADLVRLPRGSVVFEDTDPTAVKGQVQKTLDPVVGGGGAAKNNTGVNGGAKDAMSGRIRYRRSDDNSVVDVSFGGRDMAGGCGGCTLRHGDWVRFHVAVDRRNGLRRATGIELLDESFLVSDERREQGVLLSVKENLYGFIRCVQRDQNLFFHLSEVIDIQRRPLKARDELEFTVAADTKQPGRVTAVRVRRLPSGTVRFDETLACNVSAVVAREPSAAALRDTEPGQLSVAPHQLTADQLPAVASADSASASPAAAVVNVPYRHSAVVDMRQCPRIRDTVTFDLMRTRRTGAVFAANVALVRRATPPPTESAAAPSNDASAATDGTAAPALHYGYVAALKDGFGFIETRQHDREIFFHFSVVRGGGGTNSGECLENDDASPVERLKLGGEVQYTLTQSSGGRVAADSVRSVAAGTLPQPQLAGEQLDGIVLRPIRCVDPEQADYPGLVQLNTTDEVAPAFQFGITSLANKRDYLQMGDSVTFQVDVQRQRAYNIQVQRPRLQARVESVKGQYGFLDYEHDEGKKLFFHVSEVRDSATTGGVTLRAGDLVEFSVLRSQRTGRHSACSVHLLEAAAVVTSQSSSSSACSMAASSGGGGETKRGGGGASAASFTTQSERPERVIQRIRSLHIETSDVDAAALASSSSSSSLLTQQQQQAAASTAHQRARPVGVLRQPRGPDASQKRGFALARTSMSSCSEDDAVIVASSSSSSSTAGTTAMTASA